jgi:hypothetical protein
MTVDKMSVDIRNDDRMSVDRRNNRRNVDRRNDDRGDYYEMEYNRRKVILSIINSDKYRQKISCNCTDCGGPRIKGKCEFEKVYYRKNPKKPNIRVSIV